MSSRPRSSRPVTTEQLREIYELMKWGPTWTNTLPLRIVYLTTEEGRARLRPFLQPGNVDKAGGAPVNAVLAVDNSYHRYIPRLLPFRPEMADALERDSALHHRIQHSGGWMQAAYFIFAVRAVGLAAGAIGGFESGGLDAEDGPPSH